MFNPSVASGNSCFLETTGHRDARGSSDAEPPVARESSAPYEYCHADLSERDWRRLQGYRMVTEREWLDPRWQRRNAASTVDELRRVFGRLFPESLATSIARDQRQFATMPILVPPYMLNTMDEAVLWEDPIRRYMLPAASDRDPVHPSHPMSMRDSLLEADMWVVDGLTHRYPTKVLAEMLTTCPQYCGHCTRMDLVGKDVPQVRKRRFALRSAERYAEMLDYLRRTPAVRDVVVSGGDIANLPLPRLEQFVSELVEIPHIRDIRLASKALIALPPCFLATEVLRTLERLAKLASRNEVNLAIHVHANHAQSVTPLVASAARKIRETGITAIRNQGVLLCGVNDTSAALLDLSFALLDGAGITPYYFYMCDMVPGSEHWRPPLHVAQRLQDEIMGYLPGFATPRLVCDVPRVGKRYVHQCVTYDRTTGVSTWSAPPALPATRREEAPDSIGEYYDPLWSLDEAGRKYWTRQLLNGARAVDDRESATTPAHARDGGHSRTRSGEGWAPAHHGEILQGVFEQNGCHILGLLTLPCPRFETRCRVILDPDAGELVVDPPDRVKALAAGRATLDALGAVQHGGLIALSSSVPIGRGFGSSTSDAVATIRAIGDAFGSTLTPARIAALSVQAEMASDPLMFNHALLFAQRDSIVIEDYGVGLPALEILGFTTSAGGKGVDTLTLDTSSYEYADVEAYRPLRALARRALATQSAADLGRVATASALLNQRRLPIDMLSDLISAIPRAGATGLQVAHSGDIAGYLFDRALNDLDRRLESAASVLAEFGISNLWRFSA
jgi:lysine 2,3-aminomutase